MSACLRFKIEEDLWVLGICLEGALHVGYKFLRSFCFVSETGSGSVLAPKLAESDAKVKP